MAARKEVAYVSKIYFQLKSAHAVTGIYLNNIGMTETDDAGNAPYRSG